MEDESDEDRRTAVMAQSFTQQRYDPGRKPIPGMTGKVIRSIHNWVPASHCRFWPSPDPPAPTDISIRPPSKYTHKSNVYLTKRFDIPSSWLYRTWTMTHSTQPRWQSVCNVRNTYEDEWSYGGIATSLYPQDPCRWRDGCTDTVEYEKRGLQFSNSGVNKPEKTFPGWTHQGKGWRRIDKFRWEVLGWGERPRPEGVERWLVVWTSSSLVAKEGLDIYCDQPRGLSNETFHEIMNKLYATLDAPDFAKFLRANLKEVSKSRPQKRKKAMPGFKARFGSNMVLQKYMLLEDMPSSSDATFGFKAG
ncbi:hypothetical protein BX600DRAFT_461106 [Xylariales sp. PMI_506]|nr:hypothetical protein BX600DRAFT_461106 [Xylariales sp. PMI_506]